MEVLLARNPGVYRRSSGPNLMAPAHWQESYSITRSGRIYVKIDDDIVFIQEEFPSRQAAACLGMTLACCKCRTCKGSIGRGMEEVSAPW